MRRSIATLGTRTARACLALVLALIATSWESGSASADTFDSFAATDSTFPVIAHITPSAEQPGQMVIAGHGFTPGGQVLVVLHDQWGAIQHESRWVTASSVSYQPPQNLPPGEGFSFDTGGNFAEAFPVAIAAIEIPNGSQNPALGPVTGRTTPMSGVDCQANLLVQAYDRTTATWSDVLEMGLGCAG